MFCRAGRQPSAVELEPAGVLAVAAAASPPLGPDAAAVVAV